MDQWMYRQNRLWLIAGSAAGFLGAFFLYKRRTDAKPTVLAQRKSKPGTALITGASSGIGAEFARQLARQGYELVLVGRRTDLLKDLASSLSAEFGTSCEILTADLTEESDLKRIEIRAREIGDLELLINNAGFGSVGSFVEVPVDSHADMIKVHNIASVRLVHAALPGMISRRSGAIINVSSVAAFSSLPGNSVYSASKVFLNQFTKSTAIEAAGSGVKFQALCPGFTHTGFHDTPQFKDSKFHKNQIPALFWMPADEVVRQSLNALNNGPVIFIPGNLNRIITLLMGSLANRIAIPIYLHWKNV